jgi:hypothetical protein
VRLTFPFFKKAQMAQQESFPFAAVNRSHGKIRREELAIAISLVAAVFTGWQVWEAHTSFVLGNRPYVGVESVSAQYEYESSDQGGDWDVAKIRIEFKSYGNTPAFNLHLRQACTLVDYVDSDYDKEPVAPTPAPVPGLPTLLLPNASRIITCRADVLGPFPTDTNHVLKSATGHAIVAGAVDYRDVFGRSHTTGFCYWGTVPRDQKSVVQLVPCEKAESTIN